jgi:hypothetical protein
LFVSRSDVAGRRGTRGITGRGELALELLDHAAALLRVELGQLLVLVPPRLQLLFTCSTTTCRSRSIDAITSGEGVSMVSARAAETGRDREAAAQ